MSFFDVVNNLSTSKEYIYDPKDDKDVDIFMINRSFSNFPDTIMHANEMNLCPYVNKQMLYDYYHHAIQPKKKRFAKWAKPNKDEEVQLISQYYKVNIKIATQYQSLLTPVDIQNIRDKMFKGGRG